MGDSNKPELTRLAVAAAAGDRTAFRRLYRATVAQVHGQVSRLLGRGPAVEDVVQEVFLQVYEALPGFQGDAAFSTWLFRVTHNVAVSHIRRRNRGPVALAPLKGLADAVHQPDFDARRQVQALYVALDEVSADARECFVLYELEGLSLREIAALTQSPLNTVASRVRRTRERLRRLLERDSGRRRQAR